MRPVNPKKSKTFSFLLGLIYGYRTADMEMKVLSLEEFSLFNKDGYVVYYLNKRTDEVRKNEPLEEYTHVVAIKEDAKARKVKIRIFK